MERYGDGPANYLELSTKVTASGCASYRRLWQESVDAAFMQPYAANVDVAIELMPDLWSTDG
jgi:hypothetical protein